MSMTVNRIKNGRISISFFLKYSVVSSIFFLLFNNLNENIQLASSVFNSLANKDICPFFINGSSNIL